MALQPILPPAASYTCGALSQTEQVAPLLKALCGSLRTREENPRSGLRAPGGGPPRPWYSPTGSSPTRLQPRRPPPVPRTSQTCSCLSRSSCLRAFAYALPYVGACSFPQIVTLHLLRGFAQLSASRRGRRRLCHVKRQYPVPTPPRPRLPCFSPQHFSPPDTPCVDLPDGHPTPF